MHIKSARIQNYKSFNDSGEIQFEPEISVLMGRNNSGKSALLEAISLSVQHVPHLSLKTKPLPSSIYSAASTVQLVVHVSKSDCIEAVRNGEIIVWGSRDGAWEMQAILENGGDFELFFTPGNPIQGGFVGVQTPKPFVKWQYDPARDRWLQV